MCFTTITQMKDETTGNFVELCCLSIIFIILFAEIQYIGEWMQAQPPPKTEEQGVS